MGCTAEFAERDVEEKELRERDITAGKGGRRSRAPADEDDGSVGGKMREVGRG